LHRRGFTLLFALALVLLWASSAGQAVAEVVVDRGRDEIRVSVENDTVGHVLETLSKTVNLRYRSTTPLNKVIGGRFSGSLGHVLSLVLAGYDFVVVYNAQGVEIFVVAESGAKPIPPPHVDAPQPQTASKAAEKATPGISLAPRLLLPRGPSEYDMATSHLLMRH
jgi:hypothetical protein